MRANVRNFWDKKLIEREWKGGGRVQKECCVVMSVCERVLRSSNKGIEMIVIMPVALELGIRWRLLATDLAGKTRERSGS